MTNSYEKYDVRSNAVYVPREAVTIVSNADIAFLQENACSIQQQKARILLHGDPMRTLHEMIITHTRETYIQPHINEHSSKSFLVLVGEMIVVLYREDGSIQDHHRLSSCGTNGNFMIRLEEKMFHTLIVLTDTVVFLETVLGPHQETHYAKFAPSPDDKNAVDEYVVWLEQQVGIAPTRDHLIETKSFGSFD